jgi:hypothetical protein
MHTLLSEDTPRGKQMAAAFALFHLLEAGVPDAEWTAYTDGGLSGLVEQARDLDARRDMRRYAEFFAARLTTAQGRDERYEWIHLCVEATYRGTRVQVWTHVDVRPRDKAVSHG